MRALFVFTPPESKRFIAKAVAQLPEVITAKKDDEIVVAHGSTNACVTEEIVGEFLERDKFLSGQIINRILCLTQAEEKPPMVMVRKGKLVLPEPTMEETLKNFGSGSIFIKGANAVDPQGNVGVFTAHPSGGTIGWAFGILSARGSHLIVPVGLEKLIPSVKEATQHLGQDTLYYSTGVKIGMLPIMNAKVITEVGAMHILFGLHAVHIGCGGVSDSEGSVVLVAEGEKRTLDRAIEFIESIKGEAPIQPKKSLCINCLPTSPSMLISPEEQFSKRESNHCMFQGKKEDQLPPFLRQRV